MPEKPDTVIILAEAKALEDAGAQWKLRHAAAITGYSESFLRRSDCPKHYELDTGPKRKPKPWFIPSEVRAWKAARLTPAVERWRAA